MKKIGFFFLIGLTVFSGCLGTSPKGTGATAPGDPAPVGVLGGTQAAGPAEARDSAAAASPSPGGVFSPVGDAPRMEEFGLADEFRIHYLEGGDQYLTASEKRWLTIPQSGTLPIRIWVEWRDDAQPDIWHSTVDGDRLRFVFRPFHPEDSPRTSCDIVLANTGGKLGQKTDLLLLPLYGPDLDVVEGDLEIYYFVPLTNPNGGFVVPGDANHCSAGLGPMGGAETYQAFKSHPAVKYIGTFGLTRPAAL
jgi:hypothetical protein